MLLQLQWDIAFEFLHNSSCDWITGDGKHWNKATSLYFQILFYHIKCTLLKKNVQFFILENYKNGKYIFLTLLYKINLFSLILKFATTCLYFYNTLQIIFYNSYLIIMEKILSCSTVKILNCNRLYHSNFLK